MSFKQLHDEWVGDSPSITAPVELCWYVMGYVGFQPRIVRVFDKTPNHKYIIDSDHVLVLIRHMRVKEELLVDYEYNTVLINVRTGKEFTTTINTDGWAVFQRGVDSFANDFMKSVGEKPCAPDCEERDKEIMGDADELHVVV